MFSFTLGNSFSLFHEQLGADALPLEMLWVENGTFLMGSPPTEEGRSTTLEERFQLTLTDGFWLGKYPVTQSQWQYVMDSNQSHFQEGGTNRPVENVDWSDSLAFCESLNLRFRDELPAQYRFSLPTEGHWEYACRAGTTTPHYNGTTEKELGEIAWYSKNSNNSTQPVGQKKPNAWGFHDMLGNVGEWCYDALAYYPQQSTSNWYGTEDPLARMVRGCGYAETESYDVRAADRSYIEPHIRRPWFGFRLCLLSL